MEITAWQQTALANHCRLAIETPNPAFYRQAGRYSIVLTVNSGYE